MRFCRLALIALVLSAPTISHADDRTAAREHFNKGSTAFDLGDFDEAIKEYMAAYTLKNDPVILYNLGQAHRLAGHPKEALHFYRAFLSRMPDADNRGEVEAKIVELQKLVDQAGHVQTSPPAGVAGSTELGAHEKSTPAPKPLPQPEARPETTTPAQPPAPSAMPSTKPEPAAAAVETSPPAERPGRTKTITGIAVGAVGVAAVVGGVVASVMAKQANDDIVAAANNGGVYDASVQSRGIASDAAAIALYAVGGAAVVTGVVLVVLGRREAHARTQATIAPSVGARYVGLTGTF